MSPPPPGSPLRQPPPCFLGPFPLFPFYLLCGSFMTRHICQTCLFAFFSYKLPPACSTPHSGLGHKQTWENIVGLWWLLVPGVLDRASCDLTVAQDNGGAGPGNLWVFKCPSQLLLNSCARPGGKLRPQAEGALSHGHVVSWFRLHGVNLSLICTPGSLLAGSGTPTRWGDWNLGRWSARWEPHLLCCHRSLEVLPGYTLDSGPVLGAGCVCALESF